MKAYQLRIELVDSDPQIWRTFIIPAGVTFKRLHDTIQYVMGWWNYHLYEFILSNPSMRITNNEEGIDDYLGLFEMYGNVTLNEKNDPTGIIKSMLSEPMKRSKDVKIDKYLEQNPEFIYLYDFGDGWEHRVTLEKIEEDYKYPYPKIFEGEGDCPPEDVGGVGGYEEFLKIMNDKQNPEYKDLRDWAKMQNYAKFKIKEANQYMKHDLVLKRIK